MSEVSTENTKEPSLMQQALGDQWDALPKALKAHYENDESGINIAEGKLSIRFPKFMKLPLTLMRLMGALVNREGEELPTKVERVMQGGQQYWHRSIRFPDGKTIHFKSRFTYEKDRNEFIEYTNTFLGLRMKVRVENNQLIYESNGYVLKLGAIKIPLPEWLALGHALIIETALENRQFIMDFSLKHSLFGEIFVYKGKFKTL